MIWIRLCYWYSDNFHYNSNSVPSTVKGLIMKLILITLRILIVVIFLQIQFVHLIWEKYRLSSVLWNTCCNILLVDVREFVKILIDVGCIMHNHDKPNDVSWILSRWPWNFLKSCNGFDLNYLALNLSGDLLTCRSKGKIETTVSQSLSLVLLLEVRVKLVVLRVPPGGSERKSHRKGRAPTRSLNQQKSWFWSTCPFIYPYVWN